MLSFHLLGGLEKFTTLLHHEGRENLTWALAKKSFDPLAAQKKKNPKKELGRDEGTWLLDCSTPLFCSVSLVHFAHSSILMTTLKAGYLGVLSTSAILVYTLLSFPYPYW